MTRQFRQGGQYRSIWSASAYWDGGTMHMARVGVDEEAALEALIAALEPRR